MRNMFKGLIVAAMALVATPAIADPITYTLSGTFTGTRDNNPFTTFATFTGIGDTNDSFDFDSTVTVAPLSSLTAFADGTTFTVLGNSVFFVNRDFSFGGFSNENGMDYIATFTSAAFAGYDGISAIADVTGTPDALPFSYQTDLGAIRITDVTGINFSASVAGAVPEPATWAMMIGGFGMVGGAMRRRRSVKVSFA
jgi:hypothetical protein